ncbi:hypothetical protein [Actinomadura sp. CNU-125]|uniref:hypothetical protein n=1 Tax=Actinomadura sp. CNU-125 TaxID=1904961 RepID=UPI0021CC5DF7|nr:hypothetical protein [Actinomadura sp. CNU-125]
MPDETGDQPMPIWTCWNHWIAISTDDQAGVMRTLGLSKAEPASPSLKRKR